jgi:hypothetical protein
MLRLESAYHRVMHGRVRLSLRRSTLVGLLLHVGVLAAAPFEHHDLACHLKTPQHCSSCTFSPLGASASAAPVPAASHLVDAGTAAPLDSFALYVVYTPCIAGRSPPPAVS